jgi:Formin Homology 2 Domain
MLMQRGGGMRGNPSQYRPYIHHAHPQIDIEQRQLQIAAAKQQNRTPEDPPAVRRGLIRNTDHTTSSGAVHKIELSTQQQQLQQKLQRPTNASISQSQLPSIPNSQRPYNEPWEKPFILQRTTDAEPREAPKQQQPSSSGIKRGTLPIQPILRSDPPTASEVSHQQMDSQRAFLRGFLQKKQQKQQSTVALSRSAPSNANSGSKSTSPSAILKRVLNKASALSPKEKANAALSPRAKSNGGNLSLQEKMRLRFHQKQAPPSHVDSTSQHVKVDVPSRDAVRITKLEEGSISLVSKHQKTAPKSDGGYDQFVESLTREVSSHHSQLYASFLSAIDPNTAGDDILQECLLSPRYKSRVDKDTIQRLHLCLQQSGAAECRPVSQLVNDKQYKAMSTQEKKKTKKKSLDDKVKPSMQSIKFNCPLVQPHPSSFRNPEDAPVAIPPPPPFEKLRSILKPSVKVPLATVVKQDLEADPILNTRSSDSSMAIEQPATVDSTTYAKSKPQLSVTIPKIRSIDSNDTEFSAAGASNASTSSSSAAALSSSVLPPWKGMQLRTVMTDSSSVPTAASESSINHQPEWATITLRPVSSRSDSERRTQTPQSCSAVERPVVTEQMSLEDLCHDDSGPVLVIGLKDTQHQSRVSKVVIGPTHIRQIESDNEKSSLVNVIWTILKDDLEPDGMTLNMPTLKVTLILRPGRPFRYKILCFATPEECLRFATAFYNRSLDPAPPMEIASQPSMATQPPAAEEVPDLASLSSDVNSSVRMSESVLNEEEQVVLERYRELRQHKPATDALQESIGLSQQSKETTSVSVPPQGLSTLPIEVSTAELPSSPVSTFTTTTVGEVHAVIDAEQLLVDKYKLMLQRGVPPDAVRHKMTLEQVDTNIVAQVLGDSASAPEVVEKNGTTPPPCQPSLSPEDNAVAEKYRKMLKMGIPADGVRHKMTLEEVNENVVAAVLGIVDAPKNKKGEEPGVFISNKKDKLQALSDEEESVASQYRKLLKINVSKEALLSRMKQEGVSSKIIVAILGSSALSSLNLDDGAKAVGSSSTVSKLIPINWDLTENAMAGSVWEVWQNAPDPDPMDFTQLREIFQRKERDAMKQDMKRLESSQGSGKAKLLDITRSNNIAISLKAFKEFSHAELAEIIRFLDPTRKIRGERATFIRDLLPTATEIKIIDDFSGPDDRLVPAELWFRNLRGIQRLERKARVLRTMEMFTSDATEVRDNFRLLLQVCHQVMASTKLQDVLGMVLRIGNVMNEGTRNGRAAGFKFNSLLRLTQTKTADGKITVLDYLVSLFAKKGESNTLDLMSDFPDCHKASRFLISDMNNEVKLLKESLHQCKLELADLQRDQCPPKEKETGNGADSRSMLFSSIAARAGDLKDSAPLKKTNEAFAKREAFLAAIQNTRKESVSNDISLSEMEHNESKNRGATSKLIENTLAGGILRLQNFIEVVEESFQRLEKQRDESLEACKDLSRYCGESGGIGVTISLLDILSQFAKNLEEALKKYNDQRQNEARKLKVQEAKDTRTIASSSSSVDSEAKSDGKSIVFLINDVLRSANPQFKEDFKKGRVLPNPSQTLKVIYEHEQQNRKTAEDPPRLDIVSAIQKRKNGDDDEAELAKARSAFAGVLPEDRGSPRELDIDEVSSFPPSNILSPMAEDVVDETDSLEKAPHADLTASVKERALLFHHPQQKAEVSLNRLVSIAPVSTAAVAASPSKENLGGNWTPEKDPRRLDDTPDKDGEYTFDLTSSRERLGQSRRSASPGALSDVLKSLERMHVSVSVASSPPPKIPERRKSLTERAREKRWDKRGSLIETPETSQTTPPPIETESAMARWARQKRLQKRLSR